MTACNPTTQQYRALLFAAVMTISSSEIIRKNPIGTALHALQDVYLLTCEKHGLPPLTNSLSLISDKGGKRSPLLRSL